MSDAPQEFLPMSISHSTDAAADVGTRDSPSLLTTGLRKLTENGFPPVALPNTRDSPLWNRIETTCQLSLAELSALHNHACPAQPRLRGVLPRLGGDEILYKIHDERVRAVFTISNEVSLHRYTLQEELLVDSGANTELKLPARKVLQLGLQPVGGISRSRGSTNDVCYVMNFSPVLVKATFIRDGTEETVENYLLVKCDKNEYDDILESQSFDMPVNGNQRGDQFSTPQAQQRNDGTPATSSGPITEIRLTPTRHHPVDAPLQQAVIGV